MLARLLLCALGISIIGAASCWGLVILALKRSRARSAPVSVAQKGDIAASEGPVLKTRQRTTPLYEEDEHQVVMWKVENESCPYRLRLKAPGGNQ